MKTTFKVAALLITALLTAGMQAHAIPSLTFTETINNINYEVYGQTYQGTFTRANLLSGSTVFDNSLYTITGATVNLTMKNATGYSISLTIDGITQDITASTSPQVLAYTLTPTQYNYIQAQNGTFNYGVTVDCILQSAQLIVATSTRSIPDGGSTVMLFGAVMIALGLMKRNLAWCGVSKSTVS
jgi:hypothetical protein